MTTASYRNLQSGPNKSCLKLHSTDTFLGKELAMNECNQLDTVIPDCMMTLFYVPIGRGGDETFMGNLCPGGSVDGPTPVCHL